MSIPGRSEQQRRGLLFISQHQNFYVIIQLNLYDFIYLDKIDIYFCTTQVFYMVWKLAGIWILHQYGYAKTVEIPRSSGQIGSLVQDCSNSSANALELLQSCIKPLKLFAYQSWTWWPGNSWSQSINKHAIFPTMTK